MKIHKLDYVFEKPDHDSVSPKLLLVLDDEKIRTMLIIFPLEISAKEDGLYPIFNCTCGEWGCGGAFVEVKNSPEFVVWEKVISDAGNGSESHALSFSTPILFQRSNYEDVIRRLLKEKENDRLEKSIYDFDHETFLKGGLKALYDYNK